MWREHEITVQLQFLSPKHQRKAVETYAENKLTNKQTNVKTQSKNHGTTRNNTLFHHGTSSSVKL